MSDSASTRKNPFRPKTARYLAFEKLSIEIPTTNDEVLNFMTEVKKYGDLISLQRAWVISSFVAKNFFQTKLIPLSKEHKT